MDPDPFDLESPARAPGDPSATSPPPDAGPTEDAPATRRITEGPGTRIGPYKLLQPIGEGGMGAVYMAEQEKPIRRRVALKVIKAGMDTDQVVARFEAERQALALMDHPNIARVLDAGATETGRPFFVMELVNGIPITEYSDQAQLTPRERLELFVPVCQAIQHAHQKGIIHRDIKPSNVLVTMHDGKPVPKVIDFGVAKAISQPLTQRTMFTQFGAAIGKLEYMSPEQAERSGLDIDTRSDVYSLGVLLYELLTGATPLERATLREAGYPEILKRIKEEDPPKPSTRLSAYKETLASIAARRRTEPAKLARLMRGELDWIVMKALEKDRTRRYETANGLARDIERYLHDEPVEACPPSATYRLGKILRRHKRPVAAASLVLLALLGGIIGTTYGLFRAEWSRRQAVAAQHAEAMQRQVAEENQRQAMAAAEEARTVLSFLAEKMLAAGRPAGAHGGLGKDVTLRQAIDAAAPEIRTAFRDRPLVEAALSRYVGDTYQYVGELKRALPFFERAFELRGAALGADHRDTFVSMVDLGGIYLDLGQADRALPLFEELRARQTATLGADDLQTLHTAGCLLGLTHLEIGDVRPYLPRLEDAVERMKARRGPGGNTKMSMAVLGLSYLSAGQPDRAVSTLEQMMDHRVREWGRDHVWTLNDRRSLASAYLDAGSTDRAVSMLEEVVELQKAKLGPDHFLTLQSMQVLGVGYIRSGKLDRATQILEQTLNSYRTTLDADHPGTLGVMTSLGWAYLQSGKADLAIPLLERALRRSTARLGRGNPKLLHNMFALGCAYRAAGKKERARAMHEKTLERQETALGRGHPATLSTMDALGWDYLGEDKVERALPLFQQALELRKARLNLDHPDTLQSMHSLACAYLRSGKPDHALPLLKEVVERRKSRLGDDHPETLTAMDSLGELLVTMGQPTQAEPVLRTRLLLREKKDPDGWNPFQTQSLLGTALLGQQKYAEAEPLLLAGHQGLNARQAKIPPADKPRLAEAGERVVRLYDGWGKPEEAAKWRVKLAREHPAGNYVPKP
jgi:serine/threonine protein kinase/lipopolysaccharide biosynthesis regulator YciM